jgi:FtsH-binding integral membrane protein
VHEYFHGGTRQGVNRGEYMKRGVGGWLAIFLIWLTSVASLSLFLTFYLNDRAAQIEDILFGVVGLAAAAQLLRKQRSGVVLAKMFLGLGLVMIVLTFGKTTTVQVIRSVVFNCLWFGYLAYSERVKNTFPEPLKG